MIKMKVFKCISVLLVGCGILLGCGSKAPMEDAMSLITNANSALVTKDNLSIIKNTTTTVGKESAETTQKLITNDNNKSWYSTTSYAPQSDLDIKNEQVYFDGCEYIKGIDDGWISINNGSTSKIPVLEEILTMEFEISDCQKVDLIDQSGNKKIVFELSPKFIKKMQKRNIHLAEESIKSAEKQENPTKELIESSKSILEQIKSIKYEFYKLTFVVNDEGVLIEKLLEVKYKAPELVPGDNNVMVLGDILENEIKTHFIVEDYGADNNNLLEELKNKVLNNLID